MKRISISLSDSDAALLRAQAFAAGYRTPNEYISQLLHDAHNTTIQLLQPAINTTILPKSEPLSRPVGVRRIPAFIGRRTEVRE